MDVNKEKKDEAKTDVSETWNWAATSRNLGTSLAGRDTCPGAGAGADAGAGAGVGCQNFPMSNVRALKCQVSDVRSVRRQACQ